MSVDHTPKPVRRVILKPIETRLFPLPNGQQIDLGPEMGQMLKTSVSLTPILVPTDPLAQIPERDCGRHIELRSAITTLEMNVLQLGLNVGYTPAATYTTPVTGAQGSMDVTVGMIGMDFSLWDCVGENCSAVAASHSDQSTTHLNLKIQLDFDSVTSAASLIYNTELGGILRAILDEGVRQIAASDRIDELPWFAMVREYDAEASSVVFDAGAQSRIQPDQTFTVFASTEATGVCNVYKPIANVHTNQVTAVSSTASIDQVLDPRKPQAGDVVMVRKGGGAQ